MCRYTVNTIDTAFDAMMGLLPSPDRHMLSKDEEARRARLRAIRVRREFRSARAAAEALDLTESTYRSHENGSRPISEAATRLYAERFGCRFEWLWDGSGEMLWILDISKKIGENVTNEAQPNASADSLRRSSPSVRLPIYGRAEGGDDGEIVLDGTIMDNLLGPSQLAGVEGAYGLEVIGESMMKRYRPGEIVWVDPRRAVHKGDNAVFQVRMPGGELHAFIKEFVKFVDGSVVALQYNPELELRWPRDDVECIHLIVGTGIR